MEKIISLFAWRRVLMAGIFSILAIGVMFETKRLTPNFSAKVSADTTFTETAPEGISNASAVSDEQNNIEVYRAISPGVVLITVNGESDAGGDGDFFGGRESEREGGREDRSGSGSGSGIVMDKSGHILTNAHVVRDAKSLTVNINGDKVYPARVVGSDPDTDLAVLKVEAPADVLTVISFGDSDNLQVGQKVLAIGNPFGLDRTLTTGVISGLQRPIRAQNGRPIEGAIQTDASINPGNSGGPLLDKTGLLIGINSQILSPSGASNGIGFAIPVSIAKRIVPQLLQFGEVKRPRLGVGTRNLAELKGRGIRLPVEEGLLILTVAEGSAAEKAGLRETTQSDFGEVILGDIITAVNGESIGDLDDLYKILDKHKIDDTVQIEIFRQNAKTTVAVKLQANIGTPREETEKRPRMPRKKQKFEE